MSIRTPTRPTAVKVTPVKTTALAVPDTSAIKQESASITKQANAITVTDAPSYEVAGDFLRTIKTASARIDEVFDPSIEAAHKAHKAMLTAKKQFSVPLDEAEYAVKEKRRVWFAEQERIRLAEQRRLEDEARKIAEAERAAEAARVRKEQGALAARKVAAAPVIVEPVPVVASAAPREDGVTKTKRWKFKITDETLIPREFLLVNEVALGKMARTHQDTIAVPGVEFYFEYDDAVRAWSR